MSRVALAKIPALTFYKDSVTSARRTSPIPQLACVGKPCKSYQPDVVRCESLGGEGTDVDWKVNTHTITSGDIQLTMNSVRGRSSFWSDLSFARNGLQNTERWDPLALRFGRVEVSCEGWSKPGDPYVLKGSWILPTNHIQCLSSLPVGSCALEYRLVEVPKNLRSSESDYLRRPSWFECEHFDFW
jgi:hypothetical protein